MAEIPAQTPTLRIAISGAGIAGLAAAVSLRRLQGIVVDLYEQAAAFREIGASIGIGPNGLRTLEKLGVHNALHEVCACASGDGITRCTGTGGPARSSTTTHTVP